MCASCDPSSPSQKTSAKAVRTLAASSGLREPSVKSRPVDRNAIPKSPRILTTTVGSYPVPDWLAALPSEQGVIDATRVVFDIQRQAGIVVIPRTRAATFARSAHHDVIEPHAGGPAGASMAR